MRFSYTPRGARLARRLAGVRLDAWGWAYCTAAHDDVTLIVAELCANAVRHARVPGRDFRWTSVYTPPPTGRPSSSAWPSPTPSANDSPSAARSGRWTTSSAD